MKKKDYLVIFFAMLLIPSFFVFKPILQAIFPNMDSYSATLLRRALASTAVVIFIMVLRLSEGVGTFSLRLNKGVLALLPVAVVSFIPLFNGINIPSAWMLVSTIGISLMIGFYEELIFRGILLSKLAERGRKSALLVSSALFSLTHLLNMVGGADILDTIVQCVFAFGFGLVVASYKFDCDNLLAIIIVHALWDFNFKIADTNFTDTVDIIHSLGLVLVLLWGIYLLFSKHIKNASEFEAEELEAEELEATEPETAEVESAEL